MWNFEGGTRRLLSIPPYFVPYMEKHRLYEFFYVIELHRLVPLNDFIEINNVTLRCILQRRILDYTVIYVITLHFIALYCVIKNLQELVTQLLIQQPEDPIVFTKQCVKHIVRKRDIPRVVLIAPPSFGNSLA